MADIKIYGKLVNDTPESIVADATQIKAFTGKTQDDFNNEVVDAISDEQSAREAADTELSNSLNDFVELTGLSVVENPEFVKAVTDADGRLLFGIRVDGTIEWGKGMPTPLKNELQALSESLSAQISETTQNLSSQIEAVEDKTVLALGIDPTNGDINLAYGSESSLVDAELDPLTGDINLYYEL